MSQLPAKISKLRLAVEKARSIPELKVLRDTATTLETWLKARGESKASSDEAAELRLIVERKLGLMIPIQFPKGANGKDKNGKPVLKSPDVTLEKAGITKRQSVTWQMLAEVPAKEFERIVAAVKADPDLPLTPSLVIKDGWKPRKLAQKKAALDSIAACEPVSLSGRFDVLIFDPPWPIEKIDRDVRPNQEVVLDYPVQSLNEIAQDMKKKADEHACDDCHIFLWTTQRFLPACFPILESCGVSYGFTFVWHKPGGFQPVGLPQFNCEFCLYGRIGAPTFFDTKAFALCNEWPRGRHSEKPDGFYELIRRVTAGRRGDVHNRREIEGFIGAGKEAV